MSSTGKATSGGGGQTPPTGAVNPSSAELKNVGAASSIHSPETPDGGNDGRTVPPPPPPPQPRATPLMDKTIHVIRTGMDRLAQDSAGAPTGATIKLSDE
jgi:hypothetical protein